MIFVLANNHDCDVIVTFVIKKVCKATNMISKTHLTSDTPITEAFRQGTVLMDADAIRAEMHSRDSTLTAIALQAGLCESA